MLLACGQTALASLEVARLPLCAGGHRSTTDQTGGDGKGQSTPAPRPQGPHTQLEGLGDGTRAGHSSKSVLCGREHLAAHLLCYRVDLLAKHLGGLREQEKRIRGLESQVGGKADTRGGRGSTWGCDTHPAPPSQRGLGLGAPCPLYTQLEIRSPAPSFGCS